MHITDDLKPDIYNSPVILGGISSPRASRTKLAKASQSLNFKTMFNVDSQYIGQALEMTRVFQNALGSSLQFDTAKASALAKEAGLTVEKPIRAHFSNDSPGATISQVDRQVNAVIGGTMPESLRQKILDSIATGFTNLNHHSNSAWIFWSEESGSSTSYYYNLMFAIQQGSRLIAVPLGMFVSASVSKETILFITISSSANYSVDLDGLKVSQPLEG